MEPAAAKLLTTALEVSESWAWRILEKSLDRQTTKVNIEQLNEVVTEVVALVSQGLNELMTLDLEQQRTNPLTVFRRATAPITALLTELGLPPAPRDEFEQRSFPEDAFGLYPATWSDISEAMVEPGLEWGAWKAAVIMTRHRNTETSS